MLKQSTLLDILLVFAFTLSTYTIHAQQAAEIFIPIGKSPGLSNNQTILGEIKTINSVKQSFIVSNATGTYTVKINAKTQIWLDNSKIQKTNQIGSKDDCQPGRQVEIKYTEPEREKNVTAEWIKVAMNK